MEKIQFTTKEIRLWIVICCLSVIAILILPFTVNNKNSNTRKNYTNCKIDKNSCDKKSKCDNNSCSLRVIENSKSLASITIRTRNMKTNINPDISYLGSSFFCFAYILFLLKKLIQDFIGLHFNTIRIIEIIHKKDGRKRSSFQCFD